MAFTDIDLQRIKKDVGGLCNKRSPAQLRDQLRFEYAIENQSVIIYEIRPAWKMPGEFTRMPLAKLTHVDSRKIWKLFWKRASGKWMAYEPKASAKALSDLVAEIDKDVYGCFFG